MIEEWVGGIKNKPKMTNFQESDCITLINGNVAT